MSSSSHVTAPAVADRPEATTPEPQLASAPPEALAHRLHQRGLRMTPQRLQVLEAVRALGHATPEQISAATPDIDLTTVYRTVELFEELGLIRHTHLGHGAASFRLADDEHVHVVCHTCSRVIEVPDNLIDSLVDRLRTERGFDVDRSHFTVFGRCAHCHDENVYSGAVLAQHAEHSHPHDG